MADDKEDSPSPDPRDPSFWDESAPRHKRDDLVTTSAQSEQPDPAAQEKTAPRKTREELSHLTSLDKKRELYRKACAGQIKLSPPQVLAFFNNIAKHRNDMAEDDGRALRMIDDRQPRSVRALQIYAKITQEEKTRFLDQLFSLNNLCVLENNVIDGWDREGDEFLEIASKTAVLLEPMGFGLKGTENSIQSLKATIREIVFKQAHKMGFAISDPAAPLTFLCEAIQETIGRTQKERNDAIIAKNLRANDVSSPQPTLH